MVLVLSADAVQSMLDFPSAIAALSDAHIAHAQGKVVMPVRLSMAYDDRPSELEAMPAYLGSGPAFGVKLITYIGTNLARGIPAIHAVIVLFDPDTGRPILLMDGRHSTAVRTAAASALATRLLAREESRVLAVIGAGVQGRSHLEAILHVRPIETVRVYDPEMSRAQAMADEAHRAHASLDVQASTSVREAVEGAAIICTCTTSVTPILEWSWLAPGSHINAIGAHSPHARELSSDVVVRSQIVVDSREAALKEAGDFLIPISEGRLPATRIETELGQVAAGMAPGRQDAKGVTLYKACGIALQDVAMAQLCLERATRLGVGSTVDL
jgi:alanine dehydrogenase